MADEPIGAAPAVTPSPAPSSAGSPPASPVESAAVAPSPVASETASPATAPATAAPPATSTPAATETPSSLLGDAKPAPAETKPAEAPAPAAEPAKPEPVAAPTYEPLTLPEGVTLDTEAVGKLDALLGQTELATKADHAAFQDLRQQLADMYVAEMKRVSDAQQELWIKTRDDWRNKFIADNDIGGARRETTLRSCAQMIEQYGGTAEQQMELRQAFGITGMGDHPAMIRMLNNMAKVLSEGRPVPATGNRAIQPTSKSARRYSNTLNGAN